MFSGPESDAFGNLIHQRDFSRLLFLLSNAGPAVLESRLSSTCAAKIWSTTLRLLLKPRMVVLGHNKMLNCPQSAAISILNFWFNSSDYERNKLKSGLLTQYKILSSFCEIWVQKSLGYKTSYGLVGSWKSVTFQLICPGTNPIGFLS